MRDGGEFDIEVAIVGAGPHGLSAAVHLNRSGIATHVFGDPMAFWRTMPDGMLLRSNLSASNLIEPQGPFSLAGFGRATDTTVDAPVPLEDFVAYGEWVQRSAVPGVDLRHVTRLALHQGGFELGLDDGQTARARRVVLACGIAPFEHRPPGFDHLRPELVTHSARVGSLERFRERRVAIVGAGQSAFELGALISEAGADDVEILVRSERIVWLRGHSVKKALGRLGPMLYAPTDVGPLWYSRLVERPRLLGTLPRSARDRIAARCIRPACSHFVRVRLGPVRVSTGVEVVGSQFRGDAVELELSDATRRAVDRLILATGYRVDFARYPFLTDEVRRSVALSGGFPVLGRGLETSLAGLHVMGAPAAWSFGPTMRFVSGSWYAGRALAVRLGGRRARRAAAA